MTIHKVQGLEIHQWKDRAVAAEAERDRYKSGLRMIVYAVGSDERIPRSTKTVLSIARTALKEEA